MAGDPDVLVVDRVESAAETVGDLEALLPELSFALATDVPEAVAVVDDEGVDCVVSNFEVPRASGVEFVGAFALLDAVRDVDPDVPFVLYTDVGNEEIAETAFERGVTEYVPRTAGDGALARLADRVEHAVAHRRDRRRFERQARIDELLREVNQSLVRADDRETIEATVVDRLACDGGYATATWVAAEDATAAGVAAEAIETGVLATTTEPPPALADPDVAAVAAVPVAYDGDRYGAVVVGTTERGFDDTERAVLAELGDTVGDAIDAADTRAALREQNERLEAFASVVSHDLRNPLAVARAYVDELDADPADGTDAEDDADAVEAVAEALDRMDVLVDDMLELARAGSADRDRERTDLAVLARQAWATVDTAGATLSVDDDLGTARVDRSRVTQLFENAYRNSVEHGSTGNPTASGDSVQHGGGVAVTVTALPDGFAIEDDGPGFPEDGRDRIHEPGYSDADGTGLGLAIVADVVDAHGWTLATEDAADGGARLAVHDVDVER